MTRPFIPGLDPFDIVLGDCTAKELRAAVDEWRIRNPHRTEVHIRRGRCDDCERDSEHFTNVKPAPAITLD
jgi:hypothetical protein